MSRGVVIPVVPGNIGLVPGKRAVDFKSGALAGLELDVICDEILDLFGCILYYKIDIIYMRIFTEAYMIIFLTEELVHNCLSRHVFNQFKALGLLPQTPGGCAASGGN